MTPAHAGVEKSIKIAACIASEVRKVACPLRLWLLHLANPPVVVSPVRPSRSDHKIKCATNLLGSR